MKTIDITISVPIDKITIIDAHIMHDKGDRHTPESWDVDYNDVHVEGIPEEFEIVEYDDSQLDLLAIKRWEEST